MFGYNEHPLYRTNFCLVCENEAENLQDGDVHLAQARDFGMGYLKNQSGALKSMMVHFVEFFIPLYLSSTYFLTVVSL